MKPEEIDRLFRDELEKLDHVPGLEWNDEMTWKKIDSNLKGGWNHLWTWNLLAIVVVVSSYLLYHSFLPNKTPVAQPKENIPVAVVPIKNDTIVTKKENPIGKKYKVKKKVSSVKSVDTLASIKDTIQEASLEMRPDSTNIRYRQYLNRYYMSNTPLAGPALNFSMPQNSVFRLGVNNSFNLSNLLRSVEAEKKAGDNFYYIYEYNRNPSPFRGNSYPVLMQDNRQIITNFNQR